MKASRPSSVKLRAAAMAAAMCDRQSASGPVIHRRLQANTRADAAKAASARADDFCAAQGHTRASTPELPESQCTEK